jgi:hypothetical protein
VELGGRNDRPRHRPGFDETLLVPFAGVVGVALDPLDTDDRKQHVVAHPSPMFGGEQVAGGGAEVRHHLVGIRRRRVRGVDDRLDSRDRPVHTVASEEITPSERLMRTTSCPACSRAAAVSAPM